jgi:hypothetical protein
MAPEPGIDERVGEAAPPPATGTHDPRGSVAERRSRLRERVPVWRPRTLDRILDDVAADHPDRPLVVTDATGLQIGAGGARFSANGQSIVIERALGGNAPLRIEAGSRPGDPGGEWPHDRGGSTEAERGLLQAAHDIHHGAEHLP